MKTGEPHKFVRFSCFQIVSTVLDKCQYCVKQNNTVNTIRKQENRKGEVKCEIPLLLIIGTPINRGTAAVNAAHTANTMKYS